MKHIRFISLFLCAVLISAAFSVSAVSDGTVPDRSSESHYRLSVDRETATVSVTDTATGEVWTTNPADPQEDEFTQTSVLNNLRSQLIVSYYDESDIVGVIGSQISSVNRGSYEITESENKIRVDYDFSRKNEKFKIPLEYRLDGNRLTVTVPVREIEEYGDVRISEISILPNFLRGTAAEDGWLLIPDGSGALIDFSKVDSSAPGYAQRIYGRDPASAYYFDEGNINSAILPVYGMKRGTGGVLAVIGGNEAAATVNAECVGIGSSYARAWASFSYHAFDTVMIAGNDWRYKEYTAAAEQKETDDFSVTYCFLNDGDYCSMAGEYRDLLDGDGRLTKVSEDRRLTGALNVCGCTTEKTSLFGFPYTKKVTATDFSQLGTMLDRLDQGGLAVFLRDFDRQTVGDDIPTNLKWLAEVGGKRGYAALRKAHPDVRFYQMRDLLFEQCKSMLWMRQSRFAQMIGKDFLERADYSPATYEKQGTDLYALRESLLRSRSVRLFRKAAKSDTGLALENFGSILYSDRAKKHYTSRNTMSKTYQSLLNEAKKSGADTAVQGGNGYVIGFTDTVYDFPVSSSDCVLASRSVPFAQIVLSGCVNLISSPLNLQDDPETGFLHCMESGMVPCYAVTGKSNTALRRTGYKQLFGTCFDEMEALLSDRLGQAAELLKTVDGSPIVSHQNDGSVSETVFGNGTAVWVNYSDSEQKIGQETVPAGSFSFRKP